MLPTGREVVKSSGPSASMFARGILSSRLGNAFAQHRARILGRRDVHQRRKATEAKEPLSELRAPEQRLVRR